jgi:hypothetical protein
MIELTETQVQAIAAQNSKPLEVVNPATQEVFVLIRKEVYDLVCGTLKPYGRGWDDAADDDLIRKDA